MHPPHVPLSRFSCLRPAKGHVPSEPLSSLSASISQTGLCYFPEPSPPRLPRPHPPQGFLRPLPRAGNCSRLPAIVHRLPLCARGSGRPANRNQLSRIPRPLGLSSLFPAQASWQENGAAGSTDPLGQWGVSGAVAVAEPPPQCPPGGGGR